MSNLKIIKLEELKEKLDKVDDTLLVNVLSSSSYEAIHIPKSINIDITQPDFLEKIKEITGGNKDKEIIVHCSSDTCQSSPAAARKLVEAEYTNVYDFEGGLADWKDAEYPLEGAMVN